MTKLGKLFRRYKKECIALFIFVLCLGIFSVSYAFAAVEPVRSIVIQSENTDFASGEEGSWQVTKSGYWTNYGEAEVTLDVDTSLMTNNQYTDIIFVLDISGSMSGEKLERVKSDSKELISSLLSNGNSKAALITFDTSSQIVSELTNDEELLINEIDKLEATGQTNYYQALVNVDTILQDYKQENGRKLITLFLTDGFPCVDTPNQITQYQYLKSAYPYITINGIQYEMGNGILNTIKEISDNQFIANMDTLNNVLFDASVAPTPYETYQISDYIDNENFTLGSVDDVQVTEGKVELIKENGRQKIIWTLNNLTSGRTVNLTMKLKLNDELVNQGGIYPTNESTEVISKIENQEEKVTTSNTPILADNYQVIYDGNAPEGCTVNNIPEAYNYSVYSTIEISDAVPTCEGYQFMGWTIETKEVTRVGEDYFIMPESDVIIKAEWSKVGITKSMNGTVNNMGEPIMKEYKYGAYGDPNGEPIYDITTTDYHSEEYRYSITSIVTKDNIDIPSTAIEFWDVSSAGDGSVIAYIEDDGSGQGTYKVTIGGQGEIIANPNSGGVFAMFPSLQTIDLTYLDINRVTNMGGKFTESENYVEQYFGMFSYNESLQNIIFGDSWDTSRVRNMSSMFYDCRSLTNLDISSFDTSQVTDMNGMFYNCSSLTNIDLSNFDTSQVTDMNGMFYNCSSLTNLDLSNFNTSQVTNMSDMFASCYELTSLDLSNFDTSQVMDMGAMFQYCNNLMMLNLSSFKTNEVNNMCSMFEGCNNLASLDISSFDTSQVVNMNSMFFRCSSLTNLDLIDFNTSNVTDMGDMFASCSMLSSLNIDGFDTHQVTTMWEMFAGCTSLTNLNLSSFNTSQVTTMYRMFEGCSGLSILNLSNFDTSQVTTMYSMFEGCTGLSILNLSNFDTSQVTTMSYMFSDCTNLTNLDIRNAVFNATSYSNMFRSVANGINVIVKDATAKTWIESRLSDRGITGTVTIVGV